jgi:hypothetical protein
MGVVGFFPLNLSFWIVILSVGQEGIPTGPSTPTTPPSKLKPRQLSWRGMGVGGVRGPILTTKKKADLLDLSLFYGISRP